LAYLLNISNVLRLLGVCCPSNNSHVGKSTSITVKKILRGMEVSAEKAQMKKRVAITTLRFKMGTACSRRMAWTLSTLMEARVVMVAQPLIQMTYSTV
ncbi:hypothetical protein FQN60_014973, partial [Etheostoma spectabile]